MIKAGRSVEVCGTWRDAIVDFYILVEFKKVDRINFI